MSQLSESKSVFIFGAILIVASAYQFVIWASHGITWLERIANNFGSWSSQYPWAVPVCCLSLIVSGVLICGGIIKSIFTINAWRWERAFGVLAGLIFSFFLVLVIDTLFSLKEANNESRQTLLLLLPFLIIFLIAYLVAAGRDLPPITRSLQMGNGENRIFKWDFSARLWFTPLVEDSTSTLILQFIGDRNFHMNGLTDLESTYNRVHRLMPGLQSALTPQYYADLRVAAAQYFLDKIPDLNKKFRGNLENHIENAVRNASISTHKLGFGNAGKPIRANIFVNIELSTNLKEKLEVAAEAQTEAITSNVRVLSPYIPQIFEAVATGKYTSKDITRALGLFAAPGNGQITSAEDFFKEFVEKFEASELPDKEKDELLLPLVYTDDQPAMSGERPGRDFDNI